MYEVTQTSEDERKKLRTHAEKMAVIKGNSLDSADVYSE